MERAYVQMKNIAVVSPSYKVKNHIESVITEIPNFVAHIIVVDDKCPQESGHIAEELKNSRVIVIYHEYNQGVGGWKTCSQCKYDRMCKHTYN